MHVFKDDGRSLHVAGAAAEQPVQAHLAIVLRIFVADDGILRKLLENVFLPDNQRGVVMRRVVPQDIGQLRLHMRRESVGIID